MKVFVLLLAFLWVTQPVVAISACPSAQPGKVAVVPSGAVAVSLAKPELVKVFTQKRLAQYEPFKAELQGAVWRVYGYLPPKVIGGTPEAELCQLTGEVVRVYHTQ